MHTVEESLKLLERQAELEQAAQLNGGFRLREEGAARIASAVGKISGGHSRSASSLACFAAPNR